MCSTGSAAGREWSASKESGRRLFVAALVSTLVAALIPSCRSGDERERRETQAPTRDINLVKDEHTKELMSLPGVVGVYVGALDDGRACIGVMVARKTKELEQKIPGVLEGYPVRIDETGAIKPMR